MNFIETIKKYGGVPVIILGAVVALIIVSALMSSLNSTRDKGVSFAVPTGGVNYDSSEEYMGNSLGMPELSMRNVSDSYMPPSPTEPYTPGNDSEDFEVKQYTATIESGDSKRTCSEILSLYNRTDVIFEQRHEGENDCSFTFKVERAKTAEILAFIEGMNPRDLTETAYTIKREVNDYTNELQILQNKLATLDATLAEATASYQNITALATGRGDVESLAKIIESKLTIIERLTMLRIETVNQLDRVQRGKAEALDRLAYTYFTVSVFEQTYLNGDALKDSWKASVRNFVWETNRLVQDMSIGVVSLLLTVLKFALYFLILLVVARTGWSFTKNFWQRGLTAPKHNNTTE